jgi:hypothetical protein
MKPSLFISALLAWTLPAWAEGLTVEDETFLPVGEPQIGLQATPTVAFGDKVYLAVWREGWPGQGGRARLFAARVSAVGKVLDSSPIAIAPASQGLQERPRVAFGGGMFLVVWQEFNGTDCDILAARVGMDGKVLDSRPLPVAVGPRTQALPDVASDGDRFAVVWQGLAGEETSYRGFAALVSANGKVGPPIETGATPQPKIAWNGKAYLVVCGGAGFWSGEVRGVVLGPDGKPAGKPAPVLSGTKAANFSISAVPGKGWLVISHRSPPDPWGWGGPGAMRANFVNLEGKTENSLKEESLQNRLPNWLDVGREKTKTSTWPWGASASIWDGKQSIAVWQRHHLTGEKLTSFVNSDLIAARVEGFQSLDSAGLPVAATEAEETRPALAADGVGRVLCVYEKQPKGATAKIAFRLLETTPK